jgi:Mg2+ and Co2+ transporter CorA
MQISTDERYSSGGAPGTLLTFQEGLSGDDFGEVRSKLCTGTDFILKHGVAHLLLQLTVCTIESASDIEKFADAALIDLQERLQDRNELKNSHNYKLAKKIQTECELMHRILLPMEDAFGYMCKDKFPREVLGNNVIAWNNLHVQVRRLDHNITEQKTSAVHQLTTIEDYQKEEGQQRSERVERSSFIMGLVLAMFSPLSFISGMYGMNFITPDGDPGLPELTWWKDENGGGVTGYEYFWILCGCCIVATLVLYVLAGLIPNPLSYVYDMCCGKTATTSGGSSRVPTSDTRQNDAVGEGDVLLSNLPSDK